MKNTRKCLMENLLKKFKKQTKTVFLIALISIGAAHASTIEGTLFVPSSFFVKYDKSSVVDQLQSRLREKKIKLLIREKNKIQTANSGRSYYVVTSLSEFTTQLQNQLKADCKMPQSLIYRTILDELKKQQEKTFVFLSVKFDQPFLTAGKCQIKLDFENTNPFLTMLTDAKVKYIYSEFFEMIHEKAKREGPAHYKELSQSLSFWLMNDIAQAK